MKKNDSNLNEFEYFNELFEIYGNLLTDKQKNIFKEYYQFNLSLSEIASEFNISKAAVNDALTKAKEKLISLDKELKLIDKFKKIKEKLIFLNLKEEDIKDILEVMYYGI